MNKFCLRLASNPIQIKYQNLLKTKINLSYSFASFKQNQGLKNTKSKYS